MMDEAVARAVEICKGEYEEMYVSYSPDGEYTSSDDIVAERTGQDGTDQVRE